MTQQTDYENAYQTFQNQHQLPKLNYRLIPLKGDFKNGIYQKSVENKGMNAAVMN